MTHIIHSKYYCQTEAINKLSQSAHKEAENQTLNEIPV